MSPKKIVVSPLAQSTFFKGVTPDVIVEVETYAYQREYAPRQVIIFPDDRCDYVYWVRLGRVKITRISHATGRKVAYRHLMEGDMFGEECLLGATQRQYYAEAMDPTVLTLIRSVDFLRILGEKAAFGRLVAHYLCKRAMNTEKMILGVVCFEVRQRIINSLWELYHYEQELQNNALSITHEELANLLGAARETVTQHLNRLKEEGLIHLENRRIIIRKPEAFRRLVQKE